MPIEMSYAPGERKPLDIKQDLENGYVEIEGQRYSFELMRAWGKNDLPEGKVYRIIGRCDSGWSIELIDDPGRV